MSHAAWEAWVDLGGAPPGGPEPDDLADQVALHQALRALHGDVGAEQRVLGAVRAALATDSARWRRGLRRDPRLRRRNRSALRWWPLAAAILLIALGAWLARPADPRPVIAAGTIAGTVGGHPPAGGFACAAGTELRWGDGSTLRCTSAGRLRLAADGMIGIDAGAIELTVAPRAHGAPFTVATPRERIEVLGTRFTVEVAADGTGLAVAAGRVAAVGAGGRREVAAGDRTFIAADGRAWRVVRRFIPDDAATLDLLGVGSRGTWLGRDALLARLNPDEPTAREIYLDYGRSPLPAMPGGRLVAELAVDRPTAVTLWIGERTHGADLSLPLTITADGAFHRVEVDLTALRDKGGVPAAADGAWENLILIVDDPAATLAASRIELRLPD